MDLLDPIDAERSIDTALDYPQVSEARDSTAAPKPAFRLVFRQEKDWVENFVSSFSRAAGPAAFVTAAALAARFVLI